MVFVQFVISTLTTAIRPTLTICQVARTQDARVLIAYHEPGREFAIFGPVAKHIYRRIAATSDVSIVFSSVALSTLAGARIPAPIISMHHGIPELPVPSEHDVQRVRASYDLRSDDVVLSLGFIHPYKGIESLIAVAGDIAPHKMSRPEVLIAGSPRPRQGLLRVMGIRDRAYHRKLKTQARSLRSGACITFQGYVAEADLPAVLKLARVMALPYRKATQSGIASLAIAAGLPVVASDQPGLREELGESALYFPPGNQDALRTALTAVIEDENVHRALTEESSRIRVSSSMAIIAHRILQLGLTDTTNES
jgi:glycosyltransferase involved in cell wall biosynthesis